MHLLHKTYKTGLPAMGTKVTVILGKSPFVDSRNFLAPRRKNTVVMSLFRGSITFDSIGSGVLHKSHA